MSRQVLDVLVIISRSLEFEMVINLKTAKALGLAIPQSLQGRADDIIW